MSNMDLSCHPVMLSAFFEYINSFYRHRKGSREYTELYAVVKSMGVQLRFRKRRMFWVDRGHSSGHFLTTLYNSFVMYVTHKWIYHTLGLETKHGPFAQVVDLITYGDDTLGAVPKEVLCDYNMQIISIHMMKIFGMIYTDPNKRLDVPTHLKRREVTFLARGFSRDSTGRVLAPLGNDSIYGMLMWVRKNDIVSLDEQLRTNLDVAFMEKYHHGQEEFNNFSNHVQTIL